ncbi:hypothetical protein [Streptomyces sp. WM6378]|uniref:hypothetical protein n=1 Tax=Streptomyces sp. WM6378 TaxID=1415557 RepID=UPI0006AED05D|nr:hypothetical protein [Streptomyces sp. WM6378]KOU39436.1 hypothetical protein ADK54_25605 [Streptomyces sp. WM6378]
MVIVAVLIPPLLLGVLLALGRYEERLLGAPTPIEDRLRERRGYAVPDRPSEQPRRTARPAPSRKVGPPR